MNKHTHRHIVRIHRSFPKCEECGATSFHKVYGSPHYRDCSLCGSSVRVQMKGGEVSFPNIQVFEPFIDENIDGTPHLITSKRQHIDLLKKENLVCKHYV